MPPGYKISESGRLPDETKFPGDIVIQNGIWLKDETIFDVTDKLGESDIILKGANTLDLIQKRAAIMVGDSRGGTIVAILQAVR